MSRTSYSILAERLCYDDEFIPVRTYADADYNTALDRYKREIEAINEEYGFENLFLCERFYKGRANYEQLDIVVETMRRNGYEHKINRLLRRLGAIDEHQLISYDRIKKVV